MNICNKQKTGHATQPSPRFWPLACWPSPAVKPSLAKAGMEKLPPASQGGPDMICGSQQSNSCARGKAPCRVKIPKSGCSCHLYLQRSWREAQDGELNSHPSRTAQSRDTSTMNLQGVGLRPLRSVALFHMPQGKRRPCPWFEALSNN